MGPQGEIPVAANVLSTIGTILWCIQLVPQLWHNWRRKKTEGLPGLMVFLWALSSVPFGVYAIIQNFAIPIQIQPQIFGFLALAVWGQTLYYEGGWTAFRATAVTVFFMSLFGGVEVLLLLTLRGPYRRGIDWPVLVVAIVAIVVFTAGLVPPYFEIKKRRGRVIGINWGFLCIDWLGALFSLLALVAQNTFDVLGGIMYIIVMVMEGGIFMSHALWRYRTRGIRKQAKAAGAKFDDMPEARKYQYIKPVKGVAPATETETASSLASQMEEGTKPLTVSQTEKPS